MTIGTREPAALRAHANRLIRSLRRTRGDGFEVFLGASRDRLDDGDRRVVARMRATRPGRVPEVEVRLPPEDPWADAMRQRDTTGVWPVSFSSPRGRIWTGGRRPRLLARIYPGAPYAFSDESSYLAEYRASHWGLTHRKGGWDCFRHIEVLFSGAIPLMPDADRIPASAMVHYPRRGLRELAERAAEQGPFTSRSALEDLGRHATRWLTSEAMARYLLRVGGYRGGGVLFVDPALPDQPDYLSLMTLVGLKQVLGPDVAEWRTTEYLYADHRHDPSRLYGRGFGYEGVLPPSARGRHHPEADLGALLVRTRPALVVFGSIARAGDEPLQWRSLPRALRPPAIALYGEDAGPDDGMLARMRDLGAELVVRESEADLGRASSPGT